ncbi:hypothetical protein PRZ48_003519 [Zasmidium cellare]|uniref:Uncharacterized protein n=1 Tax=Zasmidium cellare TaxID=395010 RepID=A0ABR0EWI7_ZASCE|nr:hypothetical protein PRZ48_003519 [Zasmidium cellare]
MENLRRTVAGVQSLLVQDDDFRQLAQSNVRIVQLIYTVDRLEATVQAAVDQVLRERIQAIQATTADRVARTFEQLRANDQERYVDLLKRYNNVCSEGYEPAFHDEELERRQAHAIKVLNNRVKEQSSTIQARDVALARQATTICSLEQLLVQQRFARGRLAFPATPAAAPARSSPIFPPGLSSVSAAPGYYQAYAPVAGITPVSASSGIPSISVPPHFTQAAGPPRCTCAPASASAVNMPLSAPRCPYASGPGYTSSSAPRVAPFTAYGNAPYAPRPAPSFPPSGIPNPPWPTYERPFSPTIRRPAAPAPPAGDEKIPTTPEPIPAVDTPSSPSDFDSNAETLAAGYVRLDSGADDNHADAEDSASSFSDDVDDDLPVLISDDDASSTSSSDFSLATDRSIDDEDDEAWTSVPADEADAAQEAAF